MWALYEITEYALKPVIQGRRHGGGDGGESPLKISKQGEN